MRVINLNFSRQPKQGSLNQKYTKTDATRKSLEHFQLHKKRCLLYDYDSCRPNYLITQIMHSSPKQSKPNFPYTIQDVPLASHLQQQEVV